MYLCTCIHFYIKICIVRKYIHNIHVNIFIHMYIGSQGDMDCDSDIEGENTAN
jgi:hypothetical protein